MGLAFGYSDLCHVIYFVCGRSFSFFFCPEIPDDVYGFAQTGPG